MAIGVCAVLALTFAIAWASESIARARREITDLQTPISRRALEQLEQLRQRPSERNGTRW